MSILATCPCGAQFNATPDLAGKIVSCPTCGQQFHVPIVAGSHLLNQPEVPQAAPVGMPHPQSNTHSSPQPQTAAPNWQQQPTPQPKPKQGGSWGCLAGVAVGLLMLLGVSLTAGVVVIRYFTHTVADEPTFTPVDATQVATSPAVPSTPSSSTEVASTPEATATTEVAAPITSKTQAPFSAGGKLGPLPKLTFRRSAAGKSALEYKWSEKTLVVSGSLSTKLGNAAQNYHLHCMYFPSQRSARSIKMNVGEDEVAEGSGTGFVVHPDGILVTCEHVIRNAKTITANLGGKQYPARVIDIDARRDVALLKIEAEQLPYLQISRTDEVQLTQPVNVVGYPLSDVLGKSVKVNMGAISSVDDAADGLLQIDATVNPGNSGGPLLDEHGEVLGVVSALLAGEGLSEVGFAVPFEAAQALLTKHKIPYQQGTAKERGPRAVSRSVKAVALLEIEVAETAALPAGSVVRRVSSSYSETGSSGLSSGRSGEQLKQMVVDPAGHVHYHEGSLQLPFFLGESGTLGVVSFPKDGRRTWSHVEPLVVSIPEESRRDERLLPPSLRSRSRFARPRLGFREPEPQKLRLIPVIRKTTFQIGDPQDGFVPVEERIEVEVAKTDDDLVLSVVGTGTLRFDSQAGMTKDFEFRGKMELSKDGATLNAPLVMRYEVSEYIPKEDKPATATAGKTTPPKPAAPNLPTRTRPPRPTASDGVFPASSPGLSKYDPRS